MDRAGLKTDMYVYNKMYYDTHYHRGIWNILSALRIKCVAQSGGKGLEEV